MATSARQATRRELWEEYGDDADIDYCAFYVMLEIRPIARVMYGPYSTLREAQVTKACEDSAWEDYVNTMLEDGENYRKLLEKEQS